LLSEKKIAVIGVGNMGTALIGGLLKGKLTQPKNIVAARRTESLLEELKKRFQITVTTENRKAVHAADIIILSIKPQTAATVLEEIADVIEPQQLIVSIMAGITTKFISKKIGKANPIIRAMPNTPALVDEGATALAKGEHATDHHLELASRIFKAVGKVEVLPENLLDAVTGLSGSGPAYIYMVIEALTDGGVKMGIPRTIAVRLAAQTVFGAAKLVIETGKHPAILKDEVTTPGGTAIAAIHELESHGLRNMLINAVVTATQRSKELSEIMDK
jgi:pyrroline-5-carboxylate reductase